MFKEQSVPNKNSKSLQRIHKAENKYQTNINKKRKLPDQKKILELQKRTKIL